MTDKSLKDWRCDQHLECNLKFDDYERKIKKLNYSCQLMRERLEDCGVFKKRKNRREQDK